MAPVYLKIIKIGKHLLFTKQAGWVVKYFLTKNHHNHRKPQYTFWIQIRQNFGMIFENEVVQKLMSFKWQLKRKCVSKLLFLIEKKNHKDSDDNFKNQTFALWTSNLGLWVIGFSGKFNFTYCKQLRTPLCCHQQWQIFVHKFFLEQRSYWQYFWPLRELWHNHIQPSYPYSFQLLHNHSIKIPEIYLLI